MFMKDHLSRERVILGQCLYQLLFCHFSPSVMASMYNHLVLQGMYLSSNVGDKLCAVIKSTLPGIKEKDFKLYYYTGAYNTVI